MYHGVCPHDTQLCCRRTVHASRLREQKKVWWLLVLEKYFVSLQRKRQNNMIVTGQTTANQKAKATSTRERVMASTVSVDEYFDELISQVHQEWESNLKE